MIEATPAVDNVMSFTVAVTLKSLFLSPSHFHLTSLLAQSPGWKQVYSDDLSHLHALRTLPTVMEETPRGILKPAWLVWFFLSLILAGNVASIVRLRPTNFFGVLRRGVASKTIRRMQRLSQPFPEHV
jgi:hypothetical protein